MKRRRWSWGSVREERDETAEERTKRLEGKLAETAVEECAAEDVTGVIDLVTHRVRRDHEAAQKAVRSCAEENRSTAEQVRKDSTPPLVDAG